MVPEVHGLGRIQGAGPWEIQIEDNGAPLVFIDGSDHEFWAFDVMDCVVYEDDQGVSVFCRRAGGVTLAKGAFEARRIHCKVGGRYPGDTSVKMHSIFLSARGRGGVVVGLARHCIHRAHAVPEGQKDLGVASGEQAVKSLERFGQTAPDAVAQEEQSGAKQDVHTD